MKLLLNIKNKFFNILLDVFPYVILLLLSLAALYIYFEDGLLRGDDIFFHLGNINDEYYSLINEGSFERISTYLAGNIGVGKRLFYSPLFHTISALLLALTEGLGTTVISAIKIVMFASVFVSGVFMYHFLLKASNNNKGAALLGAAVYVLYPYRIFDALCRAAFAEALAFVFIPLFFKGLYSLVNMPKKLRIMPFVEIIFGGALLYLSHNITTLFVAVFAVIFLLFNLHKIIVRIKNKNYLLFSGIALVLLIGLLAFQVFPMFELVNSGLYNISNAEVMWTTPTAVSNRALTSFDYSGFLNFPYLTSRFSETSSTKLLSGIAVYFGFTLIYFVLNSELKKVPVLKYFYFLISSAVYLGLTLLMKQRLEIVLATSSVILLNLCLELLNKDKLELAENKSILKMGDFWFLIISSLLVFFFIIDAEVWKHVPQIFLNIQFPWRLWSIFQFLIGWVVCFFVAKAKSALNFKSAALVLTGLLLVLNQGLPEKRLLREKLIAENNEAQIITPDYEMFRYNATIGWNREYIPQVFFDNEYKSEYLHSLYPKVKTFIKGEFREEYKFSPVVLQGAATYTIIERVTPNYLMDFSVSEECIVQMPLIYYPGYEITSIMDDGTTALISGENIDGLVAFTLSSGAQSVAVNYRGTKTLQVSEALSHVALLCAVTLPFVYLIIVGKPKALKGLKAEKDD